MPAQTANYAPPFSSCLTMFFYVNLSKNEDTKTTLLGYHQAHQNQSRQSTYQHSQTSYTVQREGEVEQFCLRADPMTTGWNL